MLSPQSKIAICGAGAMGAGIAQVAAQAGHAVIVLDRDEAALGRGRASIEKGAAALLKRGKIDENEAAALVGRVQWTLDVSDLAEADLVIEAIVEIPEVKKSLFDAIENATSATTVIATNTSSLSVTKLAIGLKRPKQFLGLHFFNPAPIMKLVEVVSGTDTDSKIAADAFALMENWGKVAVLAKDVPGFIVNRVARPYYGEGWCAFEEGAADAATLDFLYKDLAGFRMGPFELGDLIGHDINTAAAKSVFEAYGGSTRFKPSPAQEQLAEEGLLGRKTGRGVYDYSEGAEKPSPAFCELSDSKNLSITLAKEALLLENIFDQCGVNFSRDEGLPPGFAEIDNVFVGFTRGRTAKEEKRLLGKSVVVFDWVRDPASASMIAFSASDDGARNAALDLVSRLGKKAVELHDRPGLVVFRTLAQLANCAADAVRDQVADAGSIDRAMIYGVNYPFGPMTWAKEIGYDAVAMALDLIAEETGDDMYKPCEVLSALARKDYDGEI